jgi:sialate O-acetylesterase
VRDILIGDVWLCSGQSNMQWPVAKAMNAPEEVADADWPHIRLFSLAHASSQEPLSWCRGRWNICTPQTIGGFSAVAYYFGRKIHRQTSVPIGLVQSTWSGSMIEAWMSTEALQSTGLLDSAQARNRRVLGSYPQRHREYERLLAEWLTDTAHRPPQHPDTGNRGYALGWADPGYDDRDWEAMPVPGLWEETIGLRIDGAVWFRKSLPLPKRMRGRKLHLRLGPIDNHDETYINGTRVGGIGPDTHGAFWNHRNYTVAADVTDSDSLVIAIRVFDQRGNGGFNGFGRLIRLVDPASEWYRELHGLWKYRIEQKLDPAAVTSPWKTPGMPRPPHRPGPHQLPCRLFNAMLNPLIPFGLMGVIWYQGESNTDHADEYHILLKTLIGDLRNRWKRPDLPFGIVQLANYQQRDSLPGHSAWAEVREAQRQVAQQDSAAGLAVAIDIGEADDIHPSNKQDVGNRLALWALGRVYGKALTLSGPTFRDMTVRGDTAIVRFDHVGGGLVAKGDSLAGFAVSDGRGGFVWASASIEGDSVLVWSERVRKPAMLRYGWADNPHCTLYNKDGLPASPFRAAVGENGVAAQ